MNSTMVDRLQSDIIRTALGITAGNGPSPMVTPTGSDISHQFDARLLPMFASYVASTQLQNGSYNFNSSNEDILAAIHKLKVQHPSFDSRDSLTEGKLLTNTTRAASTQDARSQPSTRKRGIIAIADANQHNELSLIERAKKRSSSMSTTNHSSTKKRKSHHYERNVTVNDIATVSVSLSDSERRETFPLPPKIGGRKRQATVTISKSSSLSTLWDAYEMICYNMDDTVADQQAFVKKLFIQSLHRSKMNHLIDKIQKLPTRMPKSESNK